MVYKNLSKSFLTSLRYYVKLPKAVKLGFTTAKDYAASFGSFIYTDMEQKKC